MANITQNQHPHGFGMTPLFDRIPPEIRPGHWCVWVARKRANKVGKYDKLPHNGTTWISTAKPEQWLTFDQAVWWYTTYPGMFNGIGRLVEQDGITFIDVDGQGSIPEYLQNMDTYWETSPSGNGIRGISLGTVSRDTNNPVEIYAGHSPRFVTITGHSVNNKSVNNLTGQLEQWIAEHNQEQVPVIDEPLPPILQNPVLPFTLQHQNLDKIPLGCDRSQELMRITALLMHRAQGRADLTKELVFSFLVNSDWMGMALEHRSNNETKACEYLWKTVLKADAWAKAASPQGELGFQSLGEKPWRSLVTEMEVEPPDFDPACWPALIRDYATELATNIGADPSATAFTALWSVSACLDHRSELMVRRDWTEKLIVWAILIGNPSTKKSPATRPITKMMDKIEGDYNAAHEAQMAAYEQAMNRFEAQNRDRQPNEAEDEEPLRPLRPVALRLVMNGGTGQGMRDILVERPRGCAVFYDEMSDFIKRQASDVGEHPDRGFWVQCYEGGRNNTALASRGFMAVENAATPMLGCVQPGVLTPLGKNLKSDGLIQRFIPVPLRRRKTPEKKNEIPEFMSRAGEWERLLRACLLRQPTTFTISPEVDEAIRLYEEWLEEFIESVEDLHWDTGHITAMGKTTGQVLRIAGLFHIIEQRGGDQIQIEEYRKAERLVKEYVLQTQTYMYNKLFGKGEELFNLWLLDTVLTHQDDDGTITLRKIKQIGRNRPELKDGSDMMKADVVMGSMDYLQLHEVVQPAVLETTDRRSFKWFVNPEVAKDLKARADKRKERARWVKTEILKMTKRTQA